MPSMYVSKPLLPYVYKQIMLYQYKRMLYAMVDASILSIAYEIRPAPS